VAHVALVTGASRGIGAATAERLVRAGAAVVLGARKREDCESVAIGIRGRGGQAAAVELDVSDPRSVARAADEARRAAERWGPIDWLVNNAGIAASAPLVPREDAERYFDRLMQVNFHGARRMVEAFAPDMLARRSGAIVNVASSAALRGYRYIAAYSASKHALLGYARSAAFDLEGTGVSIATVCPHYVDSPMTDESVRRIAEKTGKSESEARALLAAQNPGGKLVAAGDVAEVVCELLASGENGAIVELDGATRRNIARAVRAEIVQPPGWKQPRGYSNGVAIPAGARLVAIAGQVAWDAEEKLVGAGDFVAQFRQAISNVVAVVRAAGGAPEHIVSLTVFVTDKQRYLASTRALGAVWREVVGPHYPAMALIEIAGLIEEGALLEIQGLAAIPA
jgi:NAD(P)-dependent dehydrogenase (short-subunit alcohol dehydrogenase family)